VKAILLAAVFLASTSCGYALAGRGNTLPTSIRIIGVPQFTNRSPIPDVDRVLSDAVREEFQAKGKYQVRPEEGGADAVLTATIISVVPTPTAFGSDNRPTAYAINVVASVEFKHVTDENKVLWANPSFRVSDDYQVPAGTTIDTTALASQPIQSLERLSKKFAKEVVTSIFEAF
jgi:hypothetical protein